MMNNQSCEKCGDRAKLLRKIQQHGFAMTEACLYLDGHPNCRRALAYFEKQRCAYRQCKEEFERRYGPLCAEDASSDGDWNWIDGPWPWEKEAN